MKNLLFILMLTIISCTKQMDEIYQPPPIENHDYWIANPFYGETVYVAGYNDGNGCEYEYRIGAAYAYTGRGWIIKTLHYSMTQKCGNTTTTLRWQKDGLQTKDEVKATLKALRPDMDFDLIIDEMNIE